MNVFYLLKKKIMCKALERRNSQTPFDYQYAEAFTLDGITDPLINNSYYFSAHNAQMSVFVRLGRRIDKDETWFALFWENRLYVLTQELFPAGESPLRVEKSNEEGWMVSFNGILDENVQAVFSARFIPTQQPIDFTSNMPASRMATGIANEKWSKAFFDSLQNVSGQCHYEQEGRLEGNMTFNGSSVTFNLPCVRDHSFGKRDWNYMNNHLWLMAISDSSQFNYSLVSYPVLSVLEVGNYRDEAGMHYMMEANLAFSRISTGDIPKELEFDVRLDDSRTIHVLSRLITGVTYHFQDGQYTLYENIAEFRIDSQVCRGIFEIGFNCDKGRYFNQRNLNSVMR